jgi:F-type H+-transporting ATPase subunit epsilon
MAPSSTALQCVITSPEGLVFEGTAQSVVVPAVDGELGVLPRHAPLIAALGNGELRVTLTDAAKRLRFFIHGGFLQVLKNKVSVLATHVDSLEPSAKADAEAKLLAPLPEREAWRERVEAARRRVKLVG